MELGILPLAINSTVLFFIDLFDLLEPTIRGDWELSQTAKAGTSTPTPELTTAIAMFIILGISLIYVPSVFMNVQSGNYTPLLVILQLFIGSTIVYFLKKILGYYGMCPMFNLFLAANACKVIFWQAFSPITVDTGRGPEFEGSVICLVHLTTAWTSKSRAVQEAILRKSQPNLITLGSTIFVFIAIIYLQGIARRNLS